MLPLDDIYIFVINKPFVDPNGFLDSILVELAIWPYIMLFLICFLTLKQSIFVCECEIISWICRSMFDWALRESISRFFNPMSSFLSLMCLSALWLTVSLFLLPFHNCASLTLQKEGKLPTLPLFLWCLALRCASLQAPNPGVIYNFHFQGRVLGKQRRETSVRNVKLKNHI